MSFNNERASRMRLEMMPTIPSDKHCRNNEQKYD